MFEVLLSNVGNPDLRQDSERPLPGVPSDAWVPVNSLREASVVCRDYIEENDLGVGNWSGGAVRRFADGEVVAEISYNGRAWNPGSRMFGSGIDRVEISLDETFADAATPRR